MPGGGTVTGIVILESTNGAPISRTFSSGGKSINSFFKDSSSSSTQSASSSEISSFFITTIPKVFKQLGAGIVSAARFLKSSTIQTVQFFKNIGASFNSLQEGYKQFQGLKHSLGGDSSDLKEFFDEIHKKIPNLVSFFADTKKSKSFVKLFKSKELEKTKKTLKILLGKEHNAKSVLIAEKGLGITLINQFAKSPELISQKIERLVKLVDKVMKSENGSAGESQDGSSPAQSTYELTKEKLISFLQEREERGQEGFELGLMVEIGAKQQGITLPSATSNFFSILGTLLGSKSSQTVK